MKAMSIFDDLLSTLERLRDAEKEILRERRGLPANPPENGKEIDRVPMLTWAPLLGPGDVWQPACWHEDDGEWWDDCSFAPLSIQPELYWHLPKVYCDEVR